ncbi:unnamed protein product [Blepharisma stoltei]|uniref:Uncharacterized protein n=1 Tax=Blepharisma stoltei TaxID=1481888 RepID=A0AAU9IV96_9CILI|nr:unnamed protein product [Blepharisma stoltei]
MYKKIEEEKSPAKSKIVYACVAQDQDIKLQFSLPGNIKDTISNLIQSSANKNTRCSFNYENAFHVHMYNISPNSYVVVTESSFSRKIAFEFLEDVKESYLSGSLKTLDAKVKKYNEHQDEDKLNKIKNHVQEINEIMMMNIDKVIQRGAKIEVIMDQTKELEGRARMFKKNAKEIEREFKCQNYKWSFMCIATCGLLIGIFAVIIYYAL